MNKILFAFRNVVGTKSGRLDKVWNFDTKSMLLSSPITADVDVDKTPEIVFGTKDGKLYLLDDKAKVKWVYDSQEHLDNVELMFLDSENVHSIESAPNISDLTGNGEKEILFGSEMGFLYCLNHDGKLLWKFKAGGPIRATPLIADVNGDGHKEVVIGSFDNHLYILNAKGKVLAKYDLSSPVESTPCFSDGIIYLGTVDGVFHALTFDGKQLWTYKTDDKIVAEAIAINFDGKSKKKSIVIGSMDNNLYCFTHDGMVKWIYRTNGAIIAKAAFADINGDGLMEVVVGSCDNCVHTITSDGEKIWSYETDFWVGSTPIIKDVDGDGKLEIVVGSYDHNLYVLDAEGTYMLDYVPGLSRVVHQSGGFNEMMSDDPGQHVGKKIWQFKTDGIIVGCAYIEPTGQIIVNTKSGSVSNIVHSKS